MPPSFLFSQPVSQSADPAVRASSIALLVIIGALSLGAAAPPR